MDVPKSEFDPEIPYRNEFGYPELPALWKSLYVQMLEPTHYLHDVGAPARAHFVRTGDFDRPLVDRLLGAAVDWLLVVEDFRVDCRDVWLAPTYEDTVYLGACSQEMIDGLNLARSERTWLIHQRRLTCCRTEFVKRIAADDTGQQLLDQWCEWFCDLADGVEYVGYFFQDCAAFVQSLDRTLATPDAFERVRVAQRLRATLAAAPPDFRLL